MAMAATLVVPVNGSKISPPILRDPSFLLSDSKQEQISLLLKNGRTTPNLLRATTSYGNSPFPKLDQFIVHTLGKRKGLDGSIGTWSLGNHQPFPRSISFNMKNNRWCENIGRAHKSNSIIWVVHLIDRVCWQSCHDPECRAVGFRGERIDLPEEVNVEIDEYFLDLELSALNESQIIERTDKISKAVVLEENNDFDDPELEEALRQLNIASVKVKKKNEVELKEEISKNFHGGSLPLSDITSRSNIRYGYDAHLSIKTTKNVTLRSFNDNSKVSTVLECQQSASNMESTEPWENDNNLDAVLIELASTLPELFSSANPND